MAIRVNAPSRAAQWPTGPVPYGKGPIPLCVAVSHRVYPVVFHIDKAIYIM
jgi:hypothetical protein